MRLFSDQLFITTLSFEQAFTLLLSRKKFFNDNKFPQEDHWPSDGLKIILPFYLETFQKDHPSYQCIPWMIQLKRSNQIIGELIINKKVGWSEIGYQIYPLYRGNSYATKAVSVLCDWLDNEGEKTIIAWCEKGNKASQRVLLSNHFSIKMVAEPFIQYERKLR